MADFNAEELPTVEVVEELAEPIPAEQLAAPEPAPAQVGVVRLGNPGIEVWQVT
jgi:hypothetical protein